MFENLSNVKEKAQSLLAECTKYAEENNNPQEATLFKDLAAKNEEMIYQIAIIGFMKRGKSTLLNVLLGRSDTLLAPVKTAVCTATITKYLDVSLHPQRKETAIVEFKDGGTQEIDYEELNDFINNKQNNDNEKGVKCIRVYGHFPLVRSSVAIVDTPGKGSVHREHDIIAEEFLPMADAIILAQAVDLPMDADEKQFLSSLSDTEKKKIITVITKVDSVEEKDKRASCDFVKKELASIGVPCSKVYCTAARTVLNARKEGLEKDEITKISRTAGITELENAIIRIIEDNSEQSKVMAHHIRTIDQEIKNYLDNQKTSIEVAQSGFTKNIAELESEKKKLLDDKEKFERNNKKGKERFIRDWDRAFNRFCNKLENQKKQQIIDKLSNSIQNSGLITLLQKPKQLPTEVASLIGAEIYDDIQDLENQLGEVMNRYAEDIDEDIEIYGKSVTPTDGVVKSQLVTFGNLALAGAGIAYAASYGVNALQTSSHDFNEAMGTFMNTRYSLSSTQSSLENAIDDRGVLKKGWDWIVGRHDDNPVALARNEHSSAILENVKATEALITTSAFTALRFIGVAAGAVIVSRIAYSVVKGIQAGNIKSSIPNLVNDSFAKITDDIKNQVASRKNEILETMSDYVKDNINDRQEQLDNVITAIKDNDPAYKNHLDFNYKCIQELQTQHRMLKNSIGRL